MTYPLNTELEKRSKEKISLKKNEVHLWYTKPQDVLDQDDLLIQYTALLSPKERVKQQRYKFEKDRHDALVTRAFVRDLIANYADVSPKDLSFETGRKGKPELINFPLPLRFNLSHTKNLIICAVTLEDDIGCDVENISRGNNVLAIADRYFSKSETCELFSLAEDKQRDRFFDYWTLKEAYIKAWGLGLAIPLADFSFHLDDKTTTQYNNFTIKDNIQITFATHRKDTPSDWRHWLIYPNNSVATEHRIALSLRSTHNNKDTNYQIRFFNSSPLQGYQEF